MLRQDNKSRARLEGNTGTVYTWTPCWSTLTLSARLGGNSHRCERRFPIARVYWSYGNVLLLLHCVTLVVKEPQWRNVWVRLSNRLVFSLLRKTDNKGAEVMSPGRLFQILGPVTTNDRYLDSDSTDGGRRPETISWWHVSNTTQQVGQVTRRRAAKSSVDDDRQLNWIRSVYVASGGWQVSVMWASDRATASRTREWRRLSILRSYLPCREELRNAS